GSPDAARQVSRRCGHRGATHRLGLCTGQLPAVISQPLEDKQLAGLGSCGPWRRTYRDVKLAGGRKGQGGRLFKIGELDGVHLLSADFQEKQAPLAGIGPGKVETVELPSL